MCQTVFFFRSCDDSNMVMGVERKWAPTMMKLDGDGGGGGIDPASSSGSSSAADLQQQREQLQQQQHLAPSSSSSSSSSGPQHFFLEILRTKHGVWHMWIWYLGEPDEASNFRCEISIRRKSREEETELKYSGKVHSIRIPPHRVILSGCLLRLAERLNVM